MIQTAEQALAWTTAVLKRMGELWVQSASETLADTELSFISDELSALAEALGRLGRHTQFTGNKLADQAAPTVNVSRNRHRLRQPDRAGHPQISVRILCCDSRVGRN